MHPVDTYKLEGQARAVIDAYLALPLGTKPSCPYFNNRRKKARANLRVLVGKGNPAEIAEECQIFAKLARTDIASLSTDKLKEFLVSKDLGVDCSGFAYHVLGAFIEEKTGKKLTSFVSPIRKGFVGKMIAKIRPAENIGVATFSHNKNSSVIQISEARPGDFISFIGTGKDKTYNHMVVITGIEKTNGDTRISYAHSYAWPSDGTINHGVREGDILIHGNDLLGGAWKEQGVVGEDNYTYASAKGAKEVMVRRLKTSN